MKHQQGYALATVLILLAVITLLSISTSTNTILERKMAFNVHQHQTARECAEAARLATADLMDVYVYKRGWHVNQNGTINTTDFGSDTLNKLKVITADPTEEENWAHYYQNFGDDGSIHGQRQLTEDLLFYDREGVTNREVLASVSIYRTFEGLAPGYGGATNAGYGQAGFAAANHGVNVIYDLRSYSQGACNNTEQNNAISNSDFRYIVR